MAIVQSRNGKQGSLLFQIIGFAYWDEFFSNIGKPDTRSI